MDSTYSKLANLMDVRLEYAGAIFDCDGTLADTMPLHYQAWVRALSHDPVEFDETLFYALGGMPSSKIVEVLNERYGSHLDPLEVSERKELLYLDLLPTAQPIPCALELVYNYAGRIPMAVASGGIRTVVTRTLDGLGIRDLFGVIATSEDVEHGKPAPDLFLYAAAQMGVDPTRCVVYEDSPLGLQAAESAGMVGVDIRLLMTPVCVR